MQGTEITVRELDNTLTPTGRTFTGQIEDNTGRFSVRGTLAYPFVELAADSFYFNEITGSLSAAPITYALADLHDGLAINVNLLTHLEYARVLALVDGGLSLAEAKAQAQQDVLAMFNPSRQRHQQLETLDIAQRAGNAILLAVSVILGAQAKPNSPSSFPSSVPISAPTVSWTALRRDKRSWRAWSTSSRGMLRSATTLLPVMPD